MDLEQSEITLDDATGLVLQRGGAGGRTVAVEVTTGVAMPGPCRCRWASTSRAWRGERLRPFEQIMDGTTVIVALDLGGALALQVTEDELAASPGALTDWIVSNS